MRTGGADSGAAASPVGCAVVVVFAAAGVAAGAGVSGICWTNTMPNLPPWGGVDPIIGNNPLVIAVPRAGGAVVLDMAAGFDLADDGLDVADSILGTEQVGGLADDHLQQTIRYQCLHVRAEQIVAVVAEQRLAVVIDRLDHPGGAHPHQGIRDRFEKVSELGPLWRHLLFSLAKSTVVGLGKLR